MTAAALAWVLAVAAVAYPIGVARSAGRPWPGHRVAAWYAGLAAAAAGSTLSSSADFTVHACGHLLLGMVAPLLLVLSAPVTLALRALPVDRARRLSAAVRALRPVTHPVVAAVLDIGGLWLLYTTDLHAYPVTQLHVLAAGYLFTAAIVGIDPAPHRPGPAYRGVVLVLAAAAHGILAKHLYATGAQTGAMVMYYGGDAVEVALAVLLGREWLSRSARAQRRPAASGSSTAHRG